MQHNAIRIIKEVEIIFIGKGKVAKFPFSTLTYLQYINFLKIIVHLVQLYNVTEIRYGYNQY